MRCAATACASRFWSAGADVLLRDDAAFTDAVRNTLETHGVELRCGVKVETIEPDRVADVPCDLVIVAAGFKPNVELASEAGVATGRTGAIAADDHMETNLRGVFAAGDCAETTHLVTGRPTWIPLGTTANKTGRVAGANAAGGRERFPGVVGTCIVGIFGSAFAATGLSVAQARAEGLTPVSARIEALSRPRYYEGVKTTVELVADRASGRLHRRDGDWRRRRGRPHQRDRHRFAQPHARGGFRASWIWPIRRPSPPSGILC